jgi:isopentenyl-diphosphate delta-isomerase
MSAPSGRSGQRKDDHLRLAHGQQTSAPAPNDFDDVQIVHHPRA